MTENFNKWLDKKIPIRKQGVIGTGNIPVNEFGDFCFEKAKESLYIFEEMENWLQWWGLSEEEQTEAIKDVKANPPDGTISWLWLAVGCLGEKEVKKRLKAELKKVQKK